MGASEIGDIGLFEAAELFKTSKQEQADHVRMRLAQGKASTKKARAAGNIAVKFAALLKDGKPLPVDASDDQKRAAIVYFIQDLCALTNVAIALSRQQPDAFSSVQYEQISSHASALINQCRATANTSAD